MVVVGAVALIGLVSMSGIAGAGGKPLSTDLNGAEEVPGPGDANASGQADITLNKGKGEVCFDVSWSQVDGTVYAAHIHNAPPRVAGTVVVPLFSGQFSGTDETTGCVSVAKDTVRAISQNPGDYYVNVHSTPGFESGAVRGQLGD
jgi:hypothetical protein